MTSHALLLAPVSSAAPPMPTRAQVCGLRVTFQGLTVQTQQYGSVHWFEPWIAALSPSDRHAVYAAKRAAGDTHCILGYRKGGPIYNEPPFDVYVSPDFEADGPLFVARLVEIIQARLIPVVTYDGDNAMNPVDGAPNALRQLPILDALLKTSPLGDLNQRVLFARFYDGVFYGATPESIVEFGQAFRALNPQGHLAIEHNPGHIPLGEGDADYLPGGRMQDYDVICSEFDDSDQPAQGNNTMWQIVGRMVQPYHRPADETGDPSPPFYLHTPNPRGPWVYVALEYSTKWGAYAWVRGWCTAAQVAQHRQYFTDMGCTFTG